MKSSPSIFLILVGLVLIAAGYYVYSSGSFTPPSATTNTVSRDVTQTITITQTIANQTVVQTQTITQSLTETETQYMPATGVQVSAFKINYYAKDSKAYKNVIGNATTSLFNTSCNLPLTVIDPSWPTSTTSKYRADQARGEVVFAQKCSFSNLSSGTYGVKVCVVGSPISSATKYTSKNVMPYVAIVDGAIVVGDVAGVHTHKLPCPTTKKTDIYIYRINGTAFDTLKVTVDCCGVTGINYGMNMQFIIPLQSVGIDSFFTTDTSTVLLITGFSLIIAGALLLYFFAPKRKRGRR